MKRTNRKVSLFVIFTALFIGCAAIVTILLWHMSEDSKTETDVMVEGLESVIPEIQLEEGAVKYTKTISENSLILTDIMVLQDDDNIIQSVSEYTIVNMSELSEIDRTELIAVYDEAVAVYGMTDGVICSGGVNDNFYNMEMHIDATSGAVDELASQGLLLIQKEDADVPYDGPWLYQSKSGELLFDKTCEMLENYGYTAE